METHTYARVEDEQRYVLASVPPASFGPREIVDRYLTGTRLRLRVVADGDDEVRKLGHKTKVDPARPSAVWHTTCYLDHAEFDVLATLPAATLVKRRWRCGTGCVDEFSGALSGLVLFEGDRPAEPPAGAVEVSDDERFCGGALAQLDDEAAAALVTLARRLCP